MVMQMPNTIGKCTYQLSSSLIGFVDDAFVLSVKSVFHTDGWTGASAVVVVDVDADFSSSTSAAAVAVASSDEVGADAVVDGSAAASTVVLATSSEINTHSILVQFFQALLIRVHLRKFC